MELALSGLISLIQLTVVLAAGQVISKRILEQRGLFERVVYGVGISLFIVPTISLMAAWATGLPLSNLVIMSVCLCSLLITKPWRAGKLPSCTRGEIYSLIVSALAAIVLVFVTEFHPSPGGFFFDPCLHRAALFLHEFGRDASAWTIHQPEFGDISFVLPRQDGPVFGFYSMMAAQRPANGAVVATFYSTTGGGGPVVVAILSYFAICGAATMIAFYLLESWTKASTVGITTLIGLHGLIGYMVNETTFALIAGMLFLAVLISKGQTRSFAVMGGVFFAFAIGSRIAAVSWLPSVVLFLLGKRRPMISTLILGLALGLAPWIAINTVLRGNPFYYPNADEAQVEHTILGWGFTFRPLGWPFFDLVRAKGHILPPLILLPILTIRSMGSFILGAALIGFGFLPRKEKKLFISVVLWIIPITIFLHVLAYIDSEKASWLLLAAPTLPVGLAGFIGWMEGSTKWKIGILAVLTATLAFVPRLLASFDVPIDPRTYEIIEPEEPLRDIHVRYGDKWRAELSRPALLPSFQDAPEPGRILQMLVPPDETDTLKSGRTVLMLENLNGLVQASFQMQTTKEFPELLGGVKADATAHPTRARFLLVKGEFSEQVQVTVLGHITEGEPASRPDFLRIEIDSGSGPRKPRYVAFLIIRPWELEKEPESTEVMVDNHIIALHAIGYEYEKDGARRFFPSLLTNLPVQAIPSNSGEYEGWRYRWVAYGEGVSEGTTGEVMSLLPVVW